MMAVPATMPVCAGAPLTAAVARYAALTRAQDVAGLAAFYGRDGVLVGPEGAPFSGAREVAAFLHPYAAYRVLEDAMTLDELAPTPRGWGVAGRFRQRGTGPDGAAFAAAGTYRADWACRGGRWRVLRLATIPGAAPQP
jgi:ketosteroid isomerase-like protein